MQLKKTDVYVEDTLPYSNITGKINVCKFNLFMNFYILKNKN